eukprot:scaffold180918_cov24-Tisochrysis_lutea.AAC.1
MWLRLVPIHVAAIQVQVAIKQHSAYGMRNQVSNCSLCGLGSCASTLLQHKCRQQPSNIQLMIWEIQHSVLHCNAGQSARRTQHSQSRLEEATLEGGSLEAAGWLVLRGGLTELLAQVERLPNIVEHYLIFRTVIYMGRAKRQQNNAFETQ